MTMTPDLQPEIELPDPGIGGASGRGKSMTIGAVCKALKPEFPDISIPKIRYLEDQKLLSAQAHGRRLPALLPSRTWAACARSCACSATSSCPCG